MTYTPNTTRRCQGCGQLWDGFNSKCPQCELVAAQKELLAAQKQSQASTSTSQGYDPLLDDRVRYVYTNKVDVLYVPVPTKLKDWLFTIQLIFGFALAFGIFVIGMLISSHTLYDSDLIPRFITNLARFIWSLAQ